MDNSCALLRLACNIAQRAREIVKINFGAQQVNELLGGGLETKAITEMFGEYRYIKAFDLDWQQSMTCNGHSRLFFCFIAGLAKLSFAILSASPLR